MRRLERIAKPWLEAAQRGVELILGDAHLRDVDAVKTAGKFADRCIAAGADLFDDGANSSHGTFSFDAGTRELKRISDLAPSQIKSSEHYRSVASNQTSLLWAHIGPGLSKCVATGQDAAVPIDRSELSSLTGLIEQVTDRISKMADQASAAKEDETATELFAIERALAGAKRRLNRFLGGR